jgi:hypothetical protein
MAVIRSTADFRVHCLLAQATLLDARVAAVSSIARHKRFCFFSSQVGQLGTPACRRPGYNQRGRLHGERTAHALAVCHSRASQPCRLPRRQFQPGHPHAGLPRGQWKRDTFCIRVIKKNGSVCCHHLLMSGPLSLSTALCAAGVE